MFFEYLCVGAGGFIGAMFRHLLGLIPIFKKLKFPFITIFINVLGSFVIGIISQAAAKYKNIDMRLVLFLKTGLCGGFTTFSTFALESSNLFSDSEYLIGCIYIIFSVILSFAAVALGKYFMNSL